MIDKQIDPIGWRDAKIAELEEAIREFACTGTDEPCGCYRLLSQEKTEIERLRAENEKLGAALEIARCHAVDTNEAEGMMEGFGPRRARPSDVDLQIIDEALGEPSPAGQTSP